MKFSLKTVLTTLVLCLLSFCAYAQSPNAIKDFVNNPYAPIVTSAPANVLASASLALTFTDQPADGDYIRIVGTGYDERYEFHSAATYAGDYVGMKIESAMDDTATSGAAIITRESDLVTAAYVAGTDIITFTAKTAGVRGNGIVITHDIADLTTGTMAGGLTPRSGNKGAMLVELMSSGRSKLWVRSTGTAVTGTWKCASPFAGAGTYTDASTTTCTVTMAGVVPTSIVTAVPATAFSGTAYLKSVVPGTGNALVTFSDDPGTTVTINWSAVNP